MLATEFIADKKLGREHSKIDLQDFITSYVNGHIPDYQVSAWLMAVCLRGMTPQESAALTEVMLNSGEKLTWNLNSKYLPTDKHSTGGIGDKTSLIIAPLVASFGIPVPMMAGRGLGFTGGTLDKLESIPGFKTRLSLEAFQTQMKSLGVALIGQTEEICPADRKMYSLRDVTSTVESIPLICASILSKKIAEGAKALVMDVKFGSGAFMSTFAEAKNLAKSLIEIGRIGGLNTSAILSSMNEPLGRYIGNALEMQECLDILNGKGYLLQNLDLLRSGQTLKPGPKDFSDTTFLSLELSAHMLLQAGYASDIDHCRDLCLKNLTNGKALETFKKLVSAQGGNLSDFEIGCREQKEILAKSNGYFVMKSNRDLGFALLQLGGGRKTFNDQIDHRVGLEILVRHGDPIVKDQPLFKLHLNSDENLSSVVNHVHSSFEILNQPPSTNPLIQEVLT